MPNFGLKVLKADPAKTRRAGYGSNSLFSTNPSVTSFRGSWLRTLPQSFRRFVSSHRESRPSIEVHSDSEDIERQNALKLIYKNGIQSDKTLHPSPLEYYDTNEVAMICECSQMAMYGWYWGPISRTTAQQRLHGKPNGSFLVRNSQLDLNSFTISFRTAQKTLHYRLQFADGYWQTFSTKHRSIGELIDDAMNKSKEDVFCYVKQSSQLNPPFPVRLINPINRFGDALSLQDLCRQAVRKSVQVKQMDLLPLPKKLIAFCKEK